MQGRTQLAACMARQHVNKGRSHIPMAPSIFFRLSKSHEPVRPWKVTKQWGSVTRGGWSWVQFFPYQVALITLAYWLISFSWGKTLLRIECSITFKMFPLPSKCWNPRGFFPNIYCETQLELLDLNLTILSGLPWWLGTSGFFVFLVWSCVSSLYILEINSLSEVSLANMFSYVVGSLFILLMFSVPCRSFLIPS